MPDHGTAFKTMPRAAVHRNRRRPGEMLYFSRVSQIAGVTQLVECLLPKQVAVGSSPIARSLPDFRARSGLFLALSDPPARTTTSFFLLRPRPGRLIRCLPARHESASWTVVIIGSRSIVDFRHRHSTSCRSS